MGEQEMKMCVMTLLGNLRNTLPEWDLTSASLSVGLRLGRHTEASYTLDCRNVPANQPLRVVGVYEKDHADELTEATSIEGRYSYVNVLMEIVVGLCWFTQMSNVPVTILASGEGQLLTNSGRWRLIRGEDPRWASDTHLRGTIHFEENEVHLEIRYADADTVWEKVLTP